jgi:hypothetical protein
MGLIGFNRTRRPNGFTYIPRYYDAAKEDLDNRLGRFMDPEKTKSMTNEERIELTKSRIKMSLQNKTKKYATDKSQEKSSNKRLLIIIVTLFIIAYLILQSGSIISFVSKVSQ